MVLTPDGEASERAARDAVRGGGVTRGWARTIFQRNSTRRRGGTTRAPKAGCGRGAFLEAFQRMRFNAHTLAIGLASSALCALGRAWLAIAERQQESTKTLHACLCLGLGLVSASPSSSSSSRPQRLTRHTTPYCTELHSTANRAHHLPPTIRSSDRSTQPVNTLPRHPPRCPSFAALALGLPSQAACKLPPTAYGQHRCSLRCVSCSPSEPASSPGAFGSSRMKPSSSSSSSSSLPCCSPRLFRPHSPCIRPCVCRLRSALSQFHTACTRSIILQCISLSRETSCMKRPHAHRSPLSPNSSCTSPSPSLHHPFLHSFRFRLSLFGHRFHRALILTPYGRSFTTASSTSSS